jgi:hypothetical protein
MKKVTTIAIAFFWGGLVEKKKVTIIVIAFF